MHIYRIVTEDLITLLSAESGAEKEQNSIIIVIIMIIIIVIPIINSSITSSRKAISLCTHTESDSRHTTGASSDGETAAASRAILAANPDESLDALPLAENARNNGGDGTLRDKFSNKAKRSERTALKLQSTSETKAVAVGAYDPDDGVLAHSEKMQAKRSCVE